MENIVNSKEEWVIVNPSLLGILIIYSYSSDNFVGKEYRLKSQTKLYRKKIKGIPQSQSTWPTWPPAWACASELHYRFFEKTMDIHARFVMSQEDFWFSDFRMIDGKFDKSPFISDKLYLFVTTQKKLLKNLLLIVDRNF